MKTLKRIALYCAILIALVLVASMFQPVRNAWAAITQNVNVVGGSVAVTGIANPLPVSLTSTAISSFTKPFILPAYQLSGAAVPLNIAGGATVRAGPLTVGSWYRMSCNAAVWTDQGTVAVTSVANENYLDAGREAFFLIGTNLDYISALSENGAIAGAGCSINPVTIP